MGEINGTFIHEGNPTNGATAKLWQASVFGGTPPEYDDAEPGSGQQGSSVTTGTTYGGDGAFRFTSVPDGSYYVSCYYGGHRTWQYVETESIDTILTTTGDLLYDDSGTLTRLAIGSSGQVLKVVTGKPAWQDAGLSSNQELFYESTQTGDDAWAEASGGSNATIGADDDHLAFAGFNLDTGATDNGVRFVYDGVVKSTALDNTTYQYHAYACAGLGYSATAKVEHRGIVGQVCRGSIYSVSLA